MTTSGKEALPLGQLGPYRLLRRLGAGGMAEVYLARSSGASGFEKLVALKVLRPELVDDPRFSRLLIAEARLGARFSHRNIVQVHDLGVSDGVYYMRLDYVDGADLHQLIARRRPEPGIALRIAEEIAAALAYLHLVSDDEGRPLGLVHRDVSPTNILLSRQGDVKLTDYGIAKATGLAEVTRANVRKGKYAYMSPEQVEGKPLDARTDQFSLGVTLVEVLTGTRPFEGATPLETMERVREAVLPDLPDVDEALRRVIARCLQRDPKDRFPDAQALGDALRTARRSLRGTDLHDVGRWVARLLDEET